MQRNVAAFWIVIFSLLGGFYIVHSRISQNITPDSPEAVAENAGNQKRIERSQSKNPTWYVSPMGNDNNDGTNSSSPLKTIQKAVDSALPGEIIYLGEGSYLQDFVTRRDGNDKQPITITGSSSAIVKGGGNSRIIEINHDYIHLSGFTVDGLYDSPLKADSYRDKLIYVISKEIDNGITGLKIQNMTLQNGGGECIRLRYFASNNEISYNTITRCGVHDFSFNAGGKNGEGIYIGTAPEQLNDGKNPTNDMDNSNENWIHHNTIDTQGNECVDIKEGSSKNIVEFNSCTGQKDSESGGLDARGSDNIFRYNEVYGNKGAGIRLGGDETENGINNDVYQNNLYNNDNGAIKIMRSPQGLICSNTYSGNSPSIFTGEFAEEFNPKLKCAEENE